MTAPMSYFPTGPITITAGLEKLGKKAGEGDDQDQESATGTATGKTTGTATEDGQTASTGAAAPRETGLVVGGCLAAVAAIAAAA